MWNQGPITKGLQEVEGSDEVTENKPLSPWSPMSAKDMSMPFTIRL